jgi:carboxymethylenebutenolidase
MTDTTAQPRRDPTLTEKVSADGGAFDLHVWVPQAGHGPGLLLIQEIFGVGPYIRSVATRLADLGYVVAAPDVFWRQQPNWEADHDEAGLGASFGLVQQLDFPKAVDDCKLALAWLEGMAETDGSAGAIGFCLGGSLSWAVAIAGGPAAVVSYYGSGVADQVDQLDAIDCPVLLHFGGDDSFIPSEQVDRIATAVADRPDIELVVQDGAGHAFDNHEAPMFHDADAAERAWAVTVDFLDRHLPVEQRP